MKAEEIVSKGKLPKEWSDAADEVSGLCQQAHANAENDELLASKKENHGLHAYRYETCDDGSVVALYANDADGEVKMKAFSSIEEASAWSPRDER